MSRPAVDHATLFRGSRALRIVLAGAWYQHRCGRRFGHFPVPGYDGRPSCFRCQKTLL